MLNPSPTQRYRHVTGHVLGTVAEKLGGHLWELPEKPNEEPSEQGD